MGTPAETFQISQQAAEVYESRFVPALFADWAGPTVALAGVGSGQAVLDVACGTGVVARAAAGLVGPRGQVVGLDLNEAMLVVARRVGPGIDYRQGDAASQPFADGSFDRVLCQMALMFIPDRDRSLAEMARVVCHGGVVAIAVPGSLGDQPAYRPFVDVAARHAGQEATDLLGAYWSCGDLGYLTELVMGAGLRITSTTTRLGTARFDSVDELVSVEVEGTPLAQRISSDVYARIKVDARTALREFTLPDGEVRIPLQGHIVTGMKV